MCGDSGIDSILITHPDRVARQQGMQPVLTGVDFARGPDVVVYVPAMNDVDLAESYVPFDPTTENQDKNQSEDMLGMTLLYILVTGLLVMSLALLDYIAKGNAIPSMHEASHVQKAR
jgi:hypothetical protein